MALCFVSRQIDHAEAILHLTRHPDIALVARSMIEGMCQLLWAAGNPEERARRWRAFSWVHDWRVMRSREALGEPTDESVRQKIEVALTEYGTQFLHTRRKQRDPPGDPYIVNWTGMSVWALFHEVRGDVLYEQIYRLFSDWHHWGPGGIGSRIARTESTVAYGPLAENELGTVLVAAFQSLFQSLQVLNSHLELGLEKQLALLESRFLQWRETLPREQLA